jgi:hypothetical protein
MAHLTCESPETKVHSINALDLRFQKRVILSEALYSGVEGLASSFNDFLNQLRIRQARMLHPKRRHAAIFSPSLTCEKRSNPISSIAMVIQEIRPAIFCKRMPRMKNGHW